ncbi:unnamed protein product [Dicrocoelium dendriticum]|nr:unnamed protein product [Dicrocoelium dendriticum]
MICCLGFPGMPCPLHIYEPRYRSMVRRAMNSCSRRFGLFMPGPGPCGLSEVGVVLHIQNCDPLPDGRMLIGTRGDARVRVLTARIVEGCVTIRFEFHTDSPVHPESLEAYRALSSSVHSMAADWLATVPCNTRASLVPFFGGLPAFDQKTNEPGEFAAPAWVWWLVAVLPLNNQCRYKLLACRSPEMRMRSLQNLLTRLASEPIHCGGDSSRVLSC